MKDVESIPRFIFASGYMKCQVSFTEKILCFSAGRGGEDRVEGMQRVTRKH